MKKSLYMTTALAAAGVLALGATDAVAAEKAKKMSIANGGFFKSMIAFAQNDGSFESTTSGTSRTHYDAFNIVNDSEIYFKGNTKLDSGVRVDVIVQFETDAVKGGATIDESYVKLTGGFGDIRIGTTKAGSFVLKHSSPMPGAINLETPDSNLFVIRPAATSSVGTASHIGGGDSMKIVYISPIFSGFRVGGSYTHLTPLLMHSQLLVVLPVRKLKPMMLWCSTKPIWAAPSLVLTLVTGKLMVLQLLHLKPGVSAQT